MIVEDDPFWLDRIAADLGEESDMEIVAAVSAKEEALHLLQQLEADIVLMDVNLTSNNTDGIEAARAIVRLTGEKTKIVMLTSIREQDVIVDSFRKGAINYITKSNYPKLVAAVREAHAGQAMLSPDVSEAIRSELRLSTLTPMEREVYDMKKQGLTKTQIADKLFKSVNTIKSQLRSIRDKLP